MKSVTIDNTDVSVSRISYGTGSLHHSLLRSQRLRLLETAFSVGITHFDTSPYYGFGLAESDLGLFVRNKRDRITITTKFGLYSPSRRAATAWSTWGRKIIGKVYPPVALPRVDWTSEAAEKSLHNSLRRCRTDYFDFLFLHDPIPSMIEDNVILSWLEKQRDTGKIRYWGVAGAATWIRDWVINHHPFCEVIQTKDTIEGQEADFVLGAGRSLQFTYGYLSASQNSATKRHTVGDALQRNATGSVVISTRRVHRLTQLQGISS